MGYYTDYKLIYTGDIDEGELAEVLDKVTRYSWDSELAQYGVKWYDSDQHMRSISQSYPDSVFMLSGDGEEGGDLWMAYYKNGKCQHESVKMSFDDYDEAKLK